MESPLLEKTTNLVNRVCRIANSSPDLKERLQMIVDLVSEEMGTDSCSVYLLEDDSSLVLKATNGLHEDSIGKVRLKLDEGITGAAASQKKTIFTSDAPSHPDYLYIPITGEERFQSIISTPIIAEDKNIGVFTVQAKDKRDFSINEIETIETLAELLAGIIRNSHLYEKNSSSLKELTFIHELGKKINSTLNMPELLQTITRFACEITGADCSALWLKEESGQLVRKSFFGEKVDSHLQNPFSVCSANGCKGDVLCIEKIDSSKFNKGIQNVCHQKNNPDTGYLCSPLISHSKVLGSMNVYKEPSGASASPFPDQSKRLLTLLANQASLAIDNATIYEELGSLNTRNQNQLRELNILYESARAMGTNMNLGKCLRMILRAVTVGNGLGFNRAILFLLNEDETALQGRMGLGPDSAEEANEIWQRLANQNIPDLFEWLVSMEEDSGENVSKFNELSQSLTVSLKSANCILSRTVLEKRSFNVQDAWNNEEVNKDLLEKLQCACFATVPLMASEKALGIILVDNLYSGAPIRESDLQFLAHFGNEAGWAIQNASLFTRLEEVNRDLLLTRKMLDESAHFAALGEISAEIAHEIKNPLVSVGGFARRLYQKLEEENPARKYAGIVVKEVNRLEQLLNNVLNYTKKINPKFNLENLNSIIEETLHLIQAELEEKNIRLTLQLDPDIPDSLFDAHQMKQVVTNLISNATESMAETGGELTVSTKKNGDSMTLEVTDTGGGMTEEVANNIFNSFFTTKKSGSGIGLPLVKKIVESHSGTVRVENIPGTGVRLVVDVPFKSE